MTEKNYGWFLKRSAFIKLDILSFGAALIKGTLSAAHLAGILLGFAEPWEALA